MPPPGPSLRSSIFGTPMLACAPAVVIQRVSVSCNVKGLWSIIFELFRDLAAMGGMLLWILQLSSELVVELLKRTLRREIEMVWVWHRLTSAKVLMATPKHASRNGATLNAIFLFFCFAFTSHLLPSADWNYDHDGAGAGQILKCQLENGWKVIFINPKLFHLWWIDSVVGYTAIRL